MQITIIGGGSYQWTPELLADLLGTPSLHGAHCAGGHRPGAAGEDGGAGPPAGRGPGRPADGRHHHRPAAGARGRRLRRSSPSPPAASTRWPSTSTCRPATGIRQSVGDTVGPGGINRSLRNVPVLVGRGRGHGRGVPGRLAAQHHQPDDLPDPGGLPADRRQGGRPVPRGRELDHGPGHRPRQAGRGGRARRWPGSTTSRWSPPSTSTARTGSPSWRTWWPRPGGSTPSRPHAGPPRGRGVLPARLLPAPRAGAHLPRASGGRCPPPATGTSPSSCRGCSPRRRGGGATTTSS